MPAVGFRMQMLGMWIQGSLSVSALQCAFYFSCEVGLKTPLSQMLRKHWEDVAQASEQECPSGFALTRRWLVNILTEYSQG